jgi:GTP-binding protein HflX
VSTSARPPFDPTLDELALLAERPATWRWQGARPRKAPDPALFVGSGKADEIKAAGGSRRARRHLRPGAEPGPAAQPRAHLGVPVADRTALILDIFAAARRATKASCRSNSPGCSTWPRGWCDAGATWNASAAASAQRGGPGEAQIELDRRMIGERIKSVKERLEKVKRQRGTQRRQRERRGSFRISLVGYTNAGKSTLFNALVKARAYAADQLFATLDTTTRSLWLADAGAVSLSDTVGFIRDLPHKLVEAFEATLQEAADADLLLARDRCRQPGAGRAAREVERVLDEIGAGVPQIWSATSATCSRPLPREPADWVEVHPGVRRPRVFVSARTAPGWTQLRGACQIAAADRGSLRRPPNAAGPAPMNEPAGEAAALPIQARPDPCSATLTAIGGATSMRMNPSTSKTQTHRQLPFEALRGVSRRAARARRACCVSQRRAAGR